MREGGSEDGLEELANPTGVLRGKYSRAEYSRRLYTIQRPRGESISQEKHRISDYAIFIVEERGRESTKMRDTGRARQRAAKMPRTRVLKRDQKRPKRPERVPACARGVRAAECRDIATRLD